MLWSVCPPVHGHACFLGSADACDACAPVHVLPWSLSDHPLSVARRSGQLWEAVAEEVEVEVPRCHLFLQLLPVFPVWFPVLVECLFLIPAAKEELCLFDQLGGPELQMERVP